MLITLSHTLLVSNLDGMIATKASPVLFALYLNLASMLFKYFYERFHSNELSSFLSSYAVLPFKNTSLSISLS